MFNKINIRILAGIFAVLLILTVIITLVNSGGGTASRKRSFKSEITEIDTAAVTRISIMPRNNRETVNLAKKNGQWYVAIGEEDYNADPSTVKSMLSTLASLRATRIASNSKDMWKNYEVNDSAATHVMVNEGKKVAADVYLGKFSYQQPKNQNPYMYQQQLKMTSYVRKAGDKKVYAVDGMIAMTFNRDPGDFRNRSLVRSDISKWNHLVFKSPDGVFELKKKEEDWMLDSTPADSATVSTYLSSIAWLNSSGFIDRRLVVSENPSYSLTIEGENMSSPIKLHAYPADTVNKYAVTSNLNEGSWFSGSENDLFGKVFRDKDSFMPGKENPAE